ncbi:MAG: hypothetical protein A3H67_02085 [Candidatus Buchananbacteria bacterium RIFCSPLOWO2_02_FULL_46_11b]|uniref:DUF5673 domain-containing protein n=2 Tax=Candidatus Buchananiibacteriota TaxID=1817903 RepID=A0A1G1YQP3_9BACT|nr:MAG: hypothetical protein A3B15_02470 [Candidatus Buchananbacteria bacterium RIFCSPLOWO2_01_FULL_45_31]OGY57209.1 MAG: hypothetical protein A3H67_02085 [Candidatus Buchananbacteria bacterium RIFCSPLOWO2_02_FULL_46_11b]
MAEETKEKKDFGETLFAWKFSEFPKHERGKNWYLAAGGVVVLLLLYSVFTANFLFALISIMAALIVLLFQRSNKEAEFKICEDGILVNDKFFDYKIIKHFYIIYEPPEIKTLYFEPKSLLNPRIPISLEDQNPVVIREALQQYLVEDIDHENEPISDQILRIFKL